MSTPEPLDESPAAPVETRGGDRPSGWRFPEYDEEGTFLTETADEDDAA